MTTTTGNTSSSISNNFAITISSTLRTELEALLTASERSGSSDSVSSRIAHILSISSKAETLTARITSLVSIPSLHARTVALLACDDTQRILYEEFGALSMNTIFARPDSSEHRFMCSILRLDMALKKSVAAAQHNVKEMVLPLALELARDPFISATLNNHQELKRVAQMLSEHIQDRDVLAKRAVVLYMTAIVSSPRIHAVVRAEKAYESVKQKIAYAQVLFKNHKRMTMFIATFAILLVTLVIWIAIYLRSRYQHPVTILPIIHSHTMGHF